MTDYYAYIKPKDEDKKALIELISSDNPIKIKDNFIKTIHNNIVHLGRHYMGRIFLWDANYKLSSEKISFPRYNPTKESIEKFLNNTSQKITIFDDGGIGFTCKEFLRIAYNTRGLSLTDYYKQQSPNYKKDKSLLEDISKKIPKEIKKNFSIATGEFINDGLYFSSQTNFL